MELVGLLKIYTNYGFQIFFFALAILCFGAVIAAIRKQPKIFYLSVLAPFVAVMPIMAARYVIASQLEQVVSENSTKVSILPLPRLEESEFMDRVWRNFSTSKSHSGSTPLPKGTAIWICPSEKKGCESLVISRDSKDSDLYWVIFNVNVNMRMTLGYTRLEQSDF